MIFDTHGHGRNRGLRVAGAALAALSCLGVAACGGGATGGTNADGTTTIEFGDISPNSTLTPLYVAVRQGFFQRAGLNVQVQRFQGGGATSVAALATGSVQVASGGPTNFIGSNGQEGDRREVVRPDRRP
jgi:NitT/TauT family transport system substrate-binding protein